MVTAIFCYTHHKLAGKKMTPEHMVNNAVSGAVKPSFYFIGNFSDIPYKVKNEHRSKDVFRWQRKLIACSNCRLALL